MKKFDDVVQKTSEINSLGKKYQGLPKGDFKDIPFSEPDTEEISKRAEKMKRKTLNRIYIATGIFLVFLIMGIITHRQTGGIILMGILTAVMIVFSISMTLNKTETAKCIAIFKYDEGKVGTKQKHYYVTVIVEGVIYSRIPIRRKDYDKIEEGTPVLIEKVSGWACVL